MPVHHLRHVTSKEELCRDSMERTLEREIIKHDLRHHYSKLTQVLYLINYVFRSFVIDNADIFVETCIVNLKTCKLYSAAWYHLIISCHLVSFWPMLEDTSVQTLSFTCIVPLGPKVRCKTYQSLKSLQHTKQWSPPSLPIYYYLLTI